MENGVLLWCQICVRCDSPVLLERRDNRRLHLGLQIIYLLGFGFVIQPLASQLGSGHLEL